MKKKQQIKNAHTHTYKHNRLNLNEISTKKEQQRAIDGQKL